MGWYTHNYWRTRRNSDPQRASHEATLGSDHDHGSRPQHSWHPVNRACLRTGGGLREFLSRLLRWRVHARWYAVTILTAPILIAAILFAFSLTSPSYIPGIVSTNDKAALLISGIAAGLAAGIFEELGWTGCATPQLRLRYGILTSGLIVGFLWGGWHFLVTFWGSGDSSGGLSLDLLLPPLIFYVAVLPAYRVMMVWVYDRTESLLVAILMHATLTANTNFILSPPVRGVPFMVYYLVLAAALWVVIAVITMTNSRRLSRRQLPRRVA